MQDLIDFYAKQLSLLTIVVVGIGLVLFLYSLFRKSSVFRFFKTAIVLFFLLSGIGFLALQGYKDASIGSPGLVQNFLLMAVLGIPIWASALVGIKGSSVAALRQPQYSGWLSLAWFVILSVYAILYFTLFTSNRF